MVVARKEVEPLSVDRDMRAREVLSIFAPGRADPALEKLGFSAVLEALLDDAWRDSVASRAPADLTSTPFFERKLRAGFSVYCALGLSAVACSTSRPAWLRFGAGVARALALDTDAVAAVARPWMPRLYRWLSPGLVDRCAVASAFILVMDEILDDELGHLDDDARVAAVSALARGDARLDSGLGRFLAVLVDDLRAHDPARWSSVAARVAAWARAEVELDAGASLAPRQLTIDVSMEVLAFAAPAFVGTRELAWMQGIAALGQMVDDVMDIEKDLAVGRITLAADGTWSVATIAALYARVVDDTVALLDAMGESHAPTRALYMSTLRAQLLHMARVLVENP
jgi:hypothetical protein